MCEHCGVDDCIACDHEVISKSVLRRWGSIVPAEERVNFKYKCGHIFPMPRSKYETMIRWYQDELCPDCKHADAIADKTCQYCGETRPVGKMKQVEIYINFGQKMMWFCKDKPCASYRQMGAEG